MDNEFKVGDKVVYNGPIEKDNGTVGIIKDFQNGLYYVDSPWNSFAAAHPKYLLPYKEDNEFKVGDKVVYNGVFKEFLGKIGVVMVLYENHCFVDFPWDNYYSIYLGDLLPYKEEYKEEYKDMTFNDYQTEAEKTAIYSGSLDIMYPALGLAGEVGEALNKIKKHYRDGTPLDKEDMTKELGDILWYLSALATDLDIDLEYVAVLNLEKLKDRSERGVIGGSGDYR
jgi:NTP pyrophosphatase (non-canonical NTP hydrolase)